MDRLARCFLVLQASHHVVAAASSSIQRADGWWWQRAAIDPVLKPVLLPRPHGGSHNFTLAYGGWSGTPSSFNATADALTTLGIGNGIGALEHDASLYGVYAKRGWPVDFYTKYSSCFQIKHCPNNLTSDDAIALETLEAANVFHSSSLAEWGYSFHSLQYQGNMGWWHAVLPNTTNTDDPPGCKPGTCKNTNTSMFDTLYKEDATPPGMSGYWTYPVSRVEAHDWVKAYFDERKGSIANLKPGKFHSITCISHYEMYAAVWGVDMIGLELGCQHNQASLAMARSGSRRTGKPTYASMMTWFGPAMCGCCGNATHPECTLNLTGPGFSSCSGEQAGHSSSLLKRVWAHAWWSGIGEVVMDSASCYFWKNCSYAQSNVLDYSDGQRLSVHGRNAQDLFAISTTHERGTPLTPVGIIIDELIGWTSDFGYTYAHGSVPSTGNGSSWGILPPMPHDIELDDLLNAQLFATALDGTKQSGTWNSYKNETEFLELRPTPYGEIADVHLSSVNSTLMGKYPVLLLAGDMPALARPETQQALADALDGGGTETLILRPHHVQVLGVVGLAKVNASGKVELSDEPPLSRTKRVPAIADERLRAISSKYLPVQVASVDSPGQQGLLWQVNGLPSGGWAVELSNPNGVIKTSCTPLTLDPKGEVKATLHVKIPIKTAVMWDGASSKALTVGAGGLTVAVTVPPGAVVFIEGH